ncbi:MAG: T9SS type A sorting domain-containing protein, partial [Sphingobacteriales bacterium]
TYSATASGSYTCIVTISGCSSSVSNAIGITVNAIPSAPAITAESLTTLCTGGSAALISSSLSNNQWYKDDVIISGATSQLYTATLNGTYTAKIIINGCQSPSSNAIIITVSTTPPKPTISLINNNLQSSSATGNQWFKEGALIAGATAQAYTPAANGNYSVIVTINGCSSPSSDVFTYLSTAVPDVDVINSPVKIFPNPVSSKLFILTRTATVNQTIRLSDINGKQLLLLNNTSTSIEIDMDKFASGLYILWIEDRKNKISDKKKIIKQ